jgi:urease accessory protein
MDGVQSNLAIGPAAESLYGSAKTWAAGGVGRAGEGPGRWTGTARIAGERPAGAAGHRRVRARGGRLVAAGAPRAYASSVHLADPAGAGTGLDAVRLPLPGGWVTTAWGRELHPVVAAAEALTGPAAARVPA